MARSIRINFAGAFYHVMARGNRREAIYHDESDRKFFLQVLAETCAKTGWHIHAWVLMTNHYHLLVETPEPNLVEGMKWLQNTYTRRFNVRHGLWGRVFGDRYKSVLVENSAYYYQTLVDYIHLNPARAGLLRSAKGKPMGILGYPWSSVAGGYALPPTRRAKWLAAQDGLAEFGFSDSVAGRRRFVERLDQRILEEGMERAGIPTLPAEADARCSHLRRGWYWGSQAFSEKVLRIGESTIKKDRHWSYRHSQERKAHGQMEAERLLAEGLRIVGLKESQLSELAGCDWRKIAIASRIARTTIMSMEWINQKLHMKSAANVR